MSYKKMHYGKLLAIGMTAVCLVAGCGAKEAQTTADQSAEAGETAGNTTEENTTEETEENTTEETEENTAELQEETEASDQQAGGEESNMEQNIQTIPLKELYQDTFLIGVALNPATLGEGYTETVTENFNSITCENEMKPDALLDKAASQAGVSEDPAYVAVSFERCAPAIAYCEEHGIQMRLHTLVWHSQTPDWFFHEAYDSSKELVSSELMQQRMQNYIHAVISYFDTEHPELIYTIDVVNEAFNGDAPYGIKDTDNRWYDTIGYDYLYYGFLYTKEAIAASEHMQNVTLVYNDYAMMYKTDKVLDGLDAIFAEHGAQARDYIDVIGMQGHIDTDTSMKSFCNALRRFTDAGYELQITELDIGIPGVKTGDVPTEKQLEEQGRKYRYLMEDLMASAAQGCPITSVTVWGISDDQSWRKNDQGYNAYALLFNADMSPKEAFYGMDLAEHVTSYYSYGLDY